MNHRDPSGHQDELRSNFGSNACGVCNTIHDFLSGGVQGTRDVETGFSNGVKEGLATAGAQAATAAGAVISLTPVGSALIQDGRCVAACEITGPVVDKTAQERKTERIEAWSATSYAIARFGRPN